MFLLTSCEKEIGLDYHQVKPLYVAEGAVTNTGTTIRLSMTNDMDDNSTLSTLDDATVVVISNDGTRTVIPSQRGGLYKNPELRGKPGELYQLYIDIDGHEFTSFSTMQRPPVLKSFKFVWKKMFNTRVLFGDMRLQDIANEDSYYYLHIYRNSVGYRWAVMDDRTSPDKELQQLFSFLVEDINDDDEDQLHEGDLLHIEIRSIDRRTYDYLYSMQLMNNTGTNPIQNFTGGCLGYFSAYHQITYDVVYHSADAVEEE